ncbi:hypothetical protein CHARACLAT_008671, partial [Characodon lateralis]|nr:hypothetical protein [Characodon lateralis]
MDLSHLLEDCWATPTEDPQDPQRWNLLVKGCPFAGDSHTTFVLPVSVKETVNPSLHKWFVVKLFSFVKPPKFENQVYFHCNIEICKGPNCLQNCTGTVNKKRVPLITGEKGFSSIISGGLNIQMESD